MDFQQLVTERFSVLEYEQRDVAPELVRLILEAGLAAPMACNFHPQRIKVIVSDASRAALSRSVTTAGNAGFSPWTARPATRSMPPLSPPT